MEKRSNIFAISSTIFLLTLLSKIMGFVREMVIGYFVGTSSVTDAYAIASVIPNFFLLVVQQVISIAFIPIFLRLFKRGRDEANNFVSNSALIVGAFSLVLSVIIFVFSKPIIRVFATGMDEETILLTQKMVSFSSWSLFVQSFVLIFTSFLQAKKRFIFPILAGYILDIVAIFFFWFTSKNGHYSYLGIIPLLTMCCELLILVPVACKNGFRFKAKKPLFSVEVKELIKVSIPALIGVGVQQLNLLVDKNISSLTAVGGIASLNYAQNIVNIIETLIMNSIVVVAYTTLCDFESKTMVSESNSYFVKTSSKIACLVIPFFMVLLVFSKPIIEAIYMRGAFDQTSVSLTEANLKGYSFGLVAICMNYLSIRFLYSKNDRYTPVIFSAICLVVNATLSFCSYKFTSIGVSGIAWATSIANILNSILLFAYIHKKYDVAISNIFDKNIASIIAFSTISTIISYAAFRATAPFINIYICGVICFIVFFGILLTSLFLFEKDVFSALVSVVKKNKKTEEQTTNH